jgi:hypothetical protein
MASRKDEKERRRQERLARDQSEQEQARRRRTYSIVVGGGLLAAAIVATAVAFTAGGGGGDDGGDSGGAKPLEVQAADPPEQRMTDLVQAAKAADCGLSNPEIEGRTHLSPDDKPPKYKTNPPTSGSHNPVPAEDGAYRTTPGNVHLVHSLEHGRIIVQYKPTISKRELARLKGLFDEDPYHMILVPNKRMPYEVAVTAWGHLAGCDKMTDETFDVIRTFTERYRDKGPEFVA